MRPQTDSRRPLRLEDVDVAREDMIVAGADAPVPVREFEATACWMTDAPLRPRHKVLIKRTSRVANGIVVSIDHRLDTDTFHRRPRELSCGSRRSAWPN